MVHELHQYSSAHAGTGPNLSLPLNEEQSSVQQCSSLRLVQLEQLSFPSIWSEL